MNYLKSLQEDYSRRRGSTMHKDLTCVISICLILVSDIIVQNEYLHRVGIFILVLEILMICYNTKSIYIAKICHNFSNYRF